MGLTDRIELNLGKSSVVGKIYTSNGNVSTIPLQTDYSTSSQRDPVTLFSSRLEENKPFINYAKFDRTGRLIPFKV